MSDRDYPDAPAGPFPAPPLSFTDAEGRPIDIERYDDDFEGLMAMYETFDPDDRAQGLPPSRPADIHEWLDLLVAEGLNVLATHDDRVVGHATLVPDDQGGHELAIFVVQAYQNATIGSRLIATLLGAGAEDGVERVWLSVERWNNPARRLYEKVGFERCDGGGFELEMALRLGEA
jgi:ribosomal protein S18 acetylase RimI-like enzyme